MADVAFLRAELHRTQLMLNDVTAQRNRLQYELDTIHSKHGTYRIICHLRNEIQRLTISKLLLIQSTAIEIDKLRQIIRTLSGGKSIHDFSINQHPEYSHSKMLHDLLPPPTPTSPPSDFSWKETFNIDLNEEDIDGNGHHNDSRLDHEDDIKIPEMNLDLEDGAMKPISSFNHDEDEHESESEIENDDDDDDQYVKERVASPEASGSDNGSHGDHNHSDHEHIAVAEKRPLFADSDDTGKLSIFFVILAISFCVSVYMVSPVQIVRETMSLEITTKIIDIDTMNIYRVFIHHTMHHHNYNLPETVMI